MSGSSVRRASPCELTVRSFASASARAQKVHPLAVTVDAQGIRGSVRTPSGQIELESRLVGQHNLENLLLALGVLEGLGVDLKLAARALGVAPQVPGRWNAAMRQATTFLVLVDYAHAGRTRARARRRALR